MQYCMQPHVVLAVAVGTNASNAHRRVNEENRVGCPHCCVNETYGTIYTHAERLPLGLASEAIDRNVCYAIAGRINHYTAGLARA